MTNIGDNRENVGSGNHETPPDLLELFEVLEWQKAVEEQKEQLTGEDL